MLTKLFNLKRVFEPHVLGQAAIRPIRLTAPEHRARILATDSESLPSAAFFDLSTANHELSLFLLVAGLEA